MKSPTTMAVLCQYLGPSFEVGFSYMRGRLGASNWFLAKDRNAPAMLVELMVHKRLHHALLSPSNWHWMSLACLFITHRPLRGNAKIGDGACTGANEVDLK